MPLVGEARLGLAEGAAADPFPKNGQEALARLIAGNERFVIGKTRHAHEGADWRKHLIATQKPFATILGCSDSRVPVELVYDQGFGDLFVVRVAGNVIAADVIGSLAYAAQHLKTQLFVVMGHTGCGAVTATLEALLKKNQEPERIEALLKMIEPGLKNLDFKLPFAKLLESGVEANVRWSMQQLMELPAVKPLLQSNQVKLVGAVYELETGKVRFLKD